MRYIKWMAIFMVCCAMLGCGKEEGDKNGSITGLVTDFSTGEPVASANVQLRPSGETTLTGTDGMYEFLDVPSGSYFITVSKAEYTDLVDDYVIEMKDGKKMRRDVQIKKRPASIHIYDHESHEISELDFGADGGVTQKSINIFNGGTQEITFFINKTADWISNISQTTGTLNVGETCPIVITIDRDLLASGDNTTILLVTGSAGGSKELTVKASKSGNLPVVSIAEAIAIDSTTYRIKCEVVSDNGQGVTEKGVCWNTFGDPTLDDEIIKYSSGGLGAYTIRMEGLDPSKRYYVRAYAKNSIGVGFSRVLDFRPGVVGTAPSVSTDMVVDVTTTSATCRGTVLDDGEVGVIGCGVCWGLKANPDLNGSYQAASVATVGSFSVSITGLSPNTTYHVRCYATNTQGTSYGEDLSFVTTVGLPTVSTMAVSDITSTSARGGGNVTDSGTSAVTERGVCWGKGHNPTTADSHVASGSGTGSFTVNMNGLIAGTTYYVRAYARNSVGTSYGAEESFTTGAPSLPTVTTSAVTNIGETSAKGGGKVTSDGGGPVTERGVCWSTGHNPTIADSHSSSGTGTGEFTVNLTGLTASTMYYARAYAVNSAGTVYGNEVNFSTQHGDWPDGTLPGGFSINAVQQVHFAQGNLQYRAYTNTWRFALNQSDFVGANNSNISQTYSGWIDLFGWGTSGYENGAGCYQPWCISNDLWHCYCPYGSIHNDLNYGSGKADWGYNAISNGGNQEHFGWRTLTKEEWDYLLNLRETPSGIRYAKAQVKEVEGMLLLPDDWNASIYTLSNPNQVDPYAVNNVINDSDWNTLETAGVVFFPGAGYRYDGTTVNGGYGAYWTATHYYFYSNYNYTEYVSAYYVAIGSGGEMIYTMPRDYGLSVRLARVVH